MPETNTQAQKTANWKGIGIILGIIILGLLVWLALSKQAGKTPQGELGKTPLKVEKAEVPVDKLPKDFPKEIPIEQNAKIVQNYNAEAEDGRFQATRVFESARTLSENFALYKDFFNKNGWTLTATVDETAIKAVSASKDNARAQVAISENPTNKIRTVDISVTYSPK